MQIARPSVKFVVFAAVLSIAASSSLAQEQFGQITGLVTDKSGGAMPGAKVDVTNEGTGVIKSTVANAQGIYLVTPLIPGTYKVVVSQPGFKSANHAGITLDVSQVARVDVALEVGEASQEVTVSGSATMLQTETSSVGTTVAGSGVSDLPLNGRNYLQLTTLVPGVTSGGLGGNANGIISNILYSNGMTTASMSFSIDGADVSFVQAQGTPLMPAPDAVQEFRIDNSNMSFKNSFGSAAVNVVLKSGTNAYHGDVYEFFRNDALSARNFFALTTPELRQNQFGGTLGGPVRKNNTFFFVDYQGTRNLTGGTTNTPTPTAAQRTGNFAGSPQLKDPSTGQPIPGNQIPASSIAPQAAFFLPYMPLPNTPGGTFVFSGPSSNYLDQFDVRVDQQLRSSDTLSYSYTFQQQSLYTRGAFPQVGGTPVEDRSQAATASWTHTFNPTTLNEAHVSYFRYNLALTGQGVGTNYIAQAGIGGFENLGPNGGFPNLTIAGYGSLTTNPQAPSKQTPKNWSFNDALTLVRGKHTIELGVRLLHYEKTYALGGLARGSFSFTGTYTGNGLADFLYGVPFTGTRGFPTSLTGLDQADQDAFAQDTWKVSRRLTLIGAIRYSRIPPFTALNDTISSVDPTLNRIVVASNSQGQIDTTSQAATQFILPNYQKLIVPSSQLGLPASLEYTNNHDFAPGAGIAFDAGHGFVLRAGYGLFYLLHTTSSGVQGTLNNPPFGASESISNTTPFPKQTLATLFPPLVPGAVNLAPVTFEQINPRMPSQYSQQWNLSLQKVVHGVVSMQAAYVGSRGTHLEDVPPINVPNPGPGNIQNNRPNKFFAEGGYNDDVGASDYNALQAQAEIRSWHGLYLLAGYTWAKALDNNTWGAGIAPVQNPNNLRAEWGITGGSVANRFTFASNYEIPFFRNRGALVRGVLGGWALSNIITAQSGQPFAPTMSTDPANTGTPERPNRIGSGTLPNPTINAWFNAAAFTVPAAYTYGNEGRNILRGPGLKNWDISLFKDFPLRWREGMKIQFRGEMYNFTNTPPFALPAVNIQAPATVGRILTAGAARSAQLVLKVLF